MEGSDKKRKLVFGKYCTLTEIAQIYCVSKYIMRKKIKQLKREIGKRDGYLFTPLQVEKIFDLIPLPENVRRFLPDSDME